MLGRTDSRDLVAGACEARVVVMPRNVSCGTSWSSFWMAALFVLHRAGRLGSEQLRQRLPRPEFQVTLSVGCMKIVVWGLVGRQRCVVVGKHFASQQIGAHQYNSFNCSFGLCCSFDTFAGKTLSAVSSQSKTCPSAVYSLCI